MWAYAAAALAFAWVALRLVRRWQTGGKPAMLLGLACAAAAAAIAAASYAAQPSLVVGWIAAWLDFARVAATIGFLLVLLGVLGSAKGAERGSGPWTSLLASSVVLLAAHMLFGVKPPGLTSPDSLRHQLGYGTALASAVFGLVLIEQCYRRAAPAIRWHMRPMVLGLGGMLAFDIVLYSDALLFRVMDFDVWAARGFVQAISASLILVTLRRKLDWSFSLTLSRGVIAGSTTLVLAGGYLLVIAGAGFLLRQFGGSWGSALELAAVFAALLLLATVVLSTTFRAKIRVLVAKHFFTYRYDYRHEWLRLTDTLASSGGALPWTACVKALSDLVESPGGALWLASEDGSFRRVDTVEFSSRAHRLPPDEPLLAYLRKSGWVVAIDDLVASPEKYDHLVLPSEIALAPDRWVVLPLLTAQELVGFVVLTRPRVQIELDWEVLDLLKTAGRQAASYLAYAQATEKLLESAKFDAFNRMSTFVVHDLKNLISQLQLLLSNAERHRDNPDFQRDMMTTIQHVVGRMHHLTLQLRPEASARERAQPVDVGAVARRVQALRLVRRTGLTVEADAGILAWAHEDLLERVIAHLVQNGFDASAVDQNVTVRVERRGEEVLVEVTDQGKGMTTEFMRERLFKPFQTTKETGTGIGAFECQQYVQQVGGRIEVQSALGKGTKVNIHLRGVAPARAGIGATA